MQHLTKTDWTRTFSGISVLGFHTNDWRHGAKESWQKFRKLKNFCFHLVRCCFLTLKHKMDSVSVSANNRNNGDFVSFRWPKRLKGQQRWPPDWSHRKPWWNHLKRTAIIDLHVCWHQEATTHTQDPALVVVAFVWVKNLSLTGFVCFNWMGGGRAGAWQSRYVGSWETEPIIDSEPSEATTAVAAGVCRVFRQQCKDKGFHPSSESYRRLQCSTSQKK